MADRRRVIRTRRRTLFGRLFVVFLLSATALLATAFLTLSTVATEHPRNQISQRLLEHLFHDLGAPPDAGRLAAVAQRLDVGIVAVGPGFAWASRDGLARPESLVERVDPEVGYALLWSDGDSYAMVRDGATRYFVSGLLADVTPRAYAALALGALAILLISFANYRAARRLFDPVRVIKAGTDRISSGDLGHRIPDGRDDELGELGRAVNAMADKLESMLEAKRQLLLAISHELRTPLTRAMILAEMPPEERNRDLLAASLKEINGLVGALLEAEALGDRHLALRLEPVSLGDLVRDAIGDDAGRITIAELDEDREVVVDRLRVRLLIRNLVGNAIRYGGDGPITLTATAAGPVFRIVVADRGPGVAPDHLARLTEPFYRPDASRGRRSGGHGLGLYLCRLIAESHGGRFDIASQPGAGFAATATLPIGRDRA